MQHPPRVLSSQLLPRPLWRRQDLGLVRREPGGCECAPARRACTATFGPARRTRTASGRPSRPIGWSRRARRPRTAPPCAPPACAARGRHFHRVARRFLRLRRSTPRSQRVECRAPPLQCIAMKGAYRSRAGSERRSLPRREARWHMRWRRRRRDASCATCCRTICSQ